MDFNELPIEIQCLILKDNIKHSYSLSKHIRKFMLNIFFDQCITQIPTKTELSEYLNTLPTYFFRFNYKLNDDAIIKGYTEYYHVQTEFANKYWSYEYTLLRSLVFIASNYGYYLDSVFTEYSKGEDKDMNIDMLINDVPKDIQAFGIFDVTPIYDIQTMYWLLKTRFNLFDLNQNDIDGLVIKYLIGFFKYTVDLLWKIDQRPVFLYLYFNAQLLVIPTTKETTYMMGIDSEDFEEDCSMIMTEYSNELYPKIIKRINQLYS